MSSLRSIQLGLCQEGGLGICALTRDHCPEGLPWASSRQLQSISRSHGGICLESGTVDSLYTGRCGDGLCVSHSSACTLEATFEEESRSCTLFEQNTNLLTTDSTKFGKCGDRCEWSEEFCAAGEAWTKAIDSECLCHDVRVGACKFNDVYFCALNQNSCDEASAFIDAKTLQGMSDAPDCRLCRAERNNSNGPPAAGAPSSSNQIVPSSESSSSLDTKVIVGATLGGVAGVAVVAAVLVFGRRYVQKKAATAGTTHNAKAPPMSNISFGATTSEANDATDEPDTHRQDGSDDDDDNVSL